VNTLEYYILTLFWTAAGPTSASFGNTALTETNPLTIANLETAIGEMAAYTDPTSAEPIMNRPAFLVVGPALELTARQILTSTLKMWLADSEDVTPPAPYPTTNVVAQYGLTLIVNPWLPIVDTTSGTTTWALFSNPSQIAAAEMSFLKGHENPELYQKASDQIRVGGGAVSPFEGDFATDNIYYKVRHVFGGTVLDTEGSWGSTGAGS